MSSGGWLGSYVKNKVRDAKAFGRINSHARPDVQQAYDVLLTMLDRWNAHDIEGHMEVYWKSRELLVIIDSEQFNGWQ
jgi:hypothetical protein